MDSFTVTTLVTKKEYRKYLIGTLYKKPFTIIAMLLGLYMLFMAMADFQHLSFGTPDSFLSDLGIGLFLVLFPVLVTLIASAKFRQNPSMHHEITYTFSEDAIIVKGLTFNSTLQWPHIIKLRETKKFLLLHPNRQTANFVDKSKLTDEQIAFIKSK
jgi:hypothetical protein